MKNKFLENLIKYPILFYILYFIYTIRPPFKLMIFSADRFESLFHYLLILWGIVIISYNFITRRDVFRKQNIRFIIVWIVISILTIISNITYISATSIKSIILTILSIMFFLVGYPLLRIRYVWITDGKYTPLLYGLYKDPNFTAMMGASLIFISYYIYMNGKRTLSMIERVFIVISVILEFLIISFSNSRGTVYSLLAIVILSIITIVLYKHREGELFSTATVKKIAIIILSTLLLFVMYISIQKGGFLISQNNRNTKYIYAEEHKTFVRLSIEDLEREEFSEHKGWVLEYIDVEDENKTEKISISKNDSGEEFGNGRISIWKDTIKLFSKKPIFGISPEMQKTISNTVYSNLDIPSMKEGRSIHNSYLSVLLYYGVVGLLIVVFACFKRLWPLFIKEIKYGYTDESILFYGIVFSLAASFFLESIFVNIDFEQVYLMFLLGIVTQYDKKKGDY